MAIYATGVRANVRIYVTFSTYNVSNYLENQINTYYQKTVNGKFL